LSFKKDQIEIKKYKHKYFYSRIHSVE